MSPSCQTLSNAFERSKKIPLTSFGGLQSKDLYISCSIERSLYSKQSEGLKPD